VPARDYRSIANGGITITPNHNAPPRPLPGQGGFEQVRRHIVSNQDGVLRPVTAAGVRHDGAEPIIAPPARTWTRVAGRAEATIYFLLGAWPAGVLPDANGEGVAPPFLRFLSAFGFFFSLLLRI
jgi:hypothetical protein